VVRFWVYATFCFPATAHGGKSAIGLAALVFHATVADDTHLHFAIIVGQADIYDMLLKSHVDRVIADKG
jgi:hypothetical protein